MKRVIFAVLMIALSTIVMAQNFETSEDGLSVTYTKQTNDLPMTYRSGNTYVVGNQVMNRYQYTERIFVRIVRKRMLSSIWV